MDFQKKNRKKIRHGIFLISTGIEPATLFLTGKCSIQMSYEVTVSSLFCIVKNKGKMEECNKKISVGLEPTFSILEVLRCNQLS